MSKIQEFESAKETWQRFISCLKVDFTAERIEHDIDNQAVCKAKLLQLMGIELYNKFFNLMGTQAAIDALDFNGI